MSSNVFERGGRLARAWALAVTWVAALSGCPDQGLSLTVDVQTGLVPGREFGFVSVELEGVATPRVQGRAVELGATGYRDGARIATFEGLAPGVYTVRGFLRRAPAPGAPPDGAAILVERRVVTSLTNDRVVRVVLSSDCIALECPAPAGSAAFSECLNGRCVDPRCDPSDPTTLDDYCCDASVDDCSRPTVCRADGDCEPVAMCVGAECIAGACIEQAEDTCPEGAYCSRTTLTCEGAPTPTDAGPPDASMDAADPCAGLICPFACVEGVCRGPEWTVSEGVGSAESIAAVGEDHVVTGFFEGPLTFEGCPELRVFGDLDIFVARFDDVGICQWASSFGTSGADLGRGVAADVAADRIYVTGSSEGAIDFGGGLRSPIGPGSDVFVASFAAGTGAHVWSWIGGTAADDERGASIAVDHGPSPVELVVVSTEEAGRGLSDIVIRRFGADGASLPSVGVGGPLGEDAWAVGVVPGAPGARSDVVVLGTFEGTVDFGPEDPGGMLVAMGEADAFAARYSAEGALRWVTPFGGASLEDVFGLAIDASQVLVGGAVHTEVGAGVLDAQGFLARLDATTGAVTRDVAFGAPATSEMDDVAASIAVDDRGTIHVAGLASGRWTFEGSAVGADHGACPLGCMNPYLAHLDADGTPRVVRARASSVVGVDYFRSVVTDGDRDFVAGRLEGRVHIEAIRLRP